MKSSIEDIKNLRNSKLNEMVNLLSSKDPFINVNTSPLLFCEYLKQLTNITSAELNKFRKVIDSALQNIIKMKEAKETKDQNNNDNQSGSQTQSDSVRN